MQMSIQNENQTQDQIHAVENTKVGRRSFLKIGLGFLSGLVGLEIGGGALLYLRSRSQQARSGGIVAAGLVDDYPLNSVTEFSEEGFFLIRDLTGKFLAVHRRCPHLGCQVIWNAEREQFICPCHASSFDKYGDLASPPVPRPLDTMALSIDDGQIFVDTSRVSSRERFDVSQMAVPQTVDVVRVGDE
jgi:cytochrome b6-f complex iron-sulfur subunit